VTFYARVLTVALGAVLVAQGAPALAATPTPHPISLACQQALAYEQIAARDPSAQAATDAAVARREAQASYDAAVAGLEANKRCKDAPMSLTREAYLLSMRAAAEHALNVGNWQRDLTRANMLLEQCTGTNREIPRSVGDNCRTQLRLNDAFRRKVISEATPTATPRPYNPQPAGATPRPVLGPAALPPSPPPSPRP
jgi:hypothetical protein